MGRSRASTPAGKRRSTARTARSGHRSKPAASRTRTSGRHGAKAPAKRAPAKRRAPKRATTKRSSTKRSPAKRAPSRRAPARARGSWRARLLVGALVVLALGAGYVFWLRDSSLVAIDDVEVVGVTGGESERIVDELTRVAEGMTTLHVRPEAIERAAAAFPTVESVDVDANFPHGMRIEVNERPPRMLVTAGEREVPVAVDGTLLEGVEVPEDGLPTLELDAVPATGRLGGVPLEQAQIVGAAPDPLLGLIEKVGHSEQFGVELVLRGELPVRFGSGASAPAKWAAVAAVLADAELEIANYVDVRVPQRPSVGGAAEALETIEPQV